MSGRTRGPQARDSRGSCPGPGSGSEYPPHRGYVARATRVLGGGGLDVLANRSACFVAFLIFGLAQAQRSRALQASSGNPPSHSVALRGSKQNWEGCMAGIGGVP